MRIAFDYTTGIYPGAGIARYTRSLAWALASLDSENSYALFYAAQGLPRPTPETAQAGSLFREHHNFRGVAVPISVRQMFAMWQRLRLPVPIDLFTGRCDVMHSPDFVSPPHRTGADIITVHDLSFLVVPECAQPELAAFLGKTVPKAVQRADKIIAVSEQTKQDLVRLLNAPANKIVVAYNGVDKRFHLMRRDREARSDDDGGYFTRRRGDAEFYLGDTEYGIRNTDWESREQLRKKLNLPERFILHVGTLEPRKNLKRLVEAYGQVVGARYIVPSQGADVSLVLAGRKGWLYEPILEAADKVNRAGGRVLFVDYVDDAQLPLLYNMAEVFAYPSLYEGFGLPPAEAMACGTPTLVSNDGALAEVAGNAALIIDPQSVESIAQGLERLLSDEELRARLSEAGPKQIAQFTWQAAAAKVLEVYSDFGP